MLIKDKKPYGLQVFSGVAHGFALRCNLEVPYERKHGCLHWNGLANVSRLLQGAEFKEYC